MNTKLTRRLNGSYQKLQRNRHITAFNLKLTDPEYRLWDLFFALYDWDEKHTETFGIVETVDRDISKLLPSWSYSKVCRYRNILIKKGIIIQVGKSQYKIFPIPTPEVLITPVQQDVSSVQQEIASSQQIIAPMQQIQTQTTPTPLVSYKDKNKDYQESMVIRSDEEYQEIYKVSGFEYLTPEDMKWIDRNIVEKIA